MPYRRGASIVDAIHLDGSAEAWRAAMTMPGCQVVRRPHGLEIAAPSGRTFAASGQWITRHAPTGSVRTFSPDRFHAQHEACS